MSRDLPSCAGEDRASSPAGSEQPGSDSPGSDLPGSDSPWAEAGASPVRPYVVLSFAASLDGYLDDASPERLLLSNAADFDRVDALRASCDAILVGAGTVRADNPRLLVRSAERRATRERRGLPLSPLRVVLSGRGELDPAAAVLTASGAETLVLPGDSLDAVLAELTRRGVRRLMVEGGAAVLTAFLAADLADELQLAQAPFLIGDPAAPHVPVPLPTPSTAAESAARPGFPQSPVRPMVLAEARGIGSVLFSRHLVRRGERPGPAGGPATADDARLLRLAVELARSCPPAAGAYSVGALVAAADGEVLATGFSREPVSELPDPAKNHAEEVALARIEPNDPRLRTATVYTSLEPCSPRASRPRSCTDLILAAGIRRVVFALREPSLLADCVGTARLQAAGVEVVEIPELGSLVRDVNGHLLG